jgi:hypothetical protein
VKDQVEHYTRDRQMACGQRMIERHHKKRKKEDNGVANDKVGNGTGGYL